MLTKTLYNTAIRLPAIGQGAGDNFWNSDCSYDSKINVLRLGVEQGLTFIDTAEEYGQGFSERLVGEAIQGIRDRVVLSSKFSPEHSTYDGVLKALEGSLRRLGTDYIDIYQAHWPNPALPITETMRALAQLLDEGSIHHVGLCNFSQKELIDAQNALTSARITCLQTEYNLFERTFEYNGLLDYCSENNITAIAYSPLDQGRFSGMNQDQLIALRSIGDQHNKSVAQVILRWLVSHDPVVAVTRTTNEQHLTENSQAADFDLADEEIVNINTAFHVNIVHVPTNRIRISLHGELDHDVYQTVEEALENQNGYVPSPAELAKAIINDGEFLKPVRLVPSTDNRYDYDLIGGRIRYWGWVIAHDGKEPIPSYVREGFDTR